MKPFAGFRLALELARWRALGIRPRIWWRDDDAREMSPALDRLLDLADGLPLSLAVIPYAVSPSLADRLGRAGNVTVSQHGIDHINRRQPAAGPAADYGQAIYSGPLARKILEGRSALEQVGLDPVFYTPPWNRIEPVLLEALPVAGYFALSGWNGEGALKPSLQRLDTHIDLMRWKGGARFRGAARIREELRRQLALRRKRAAFAQPIGLLTHHLDHDEQSWKFLSGLLTQLQDVADFGRFEEFTGG
jgi:hypothetical protein